jgi:phosphate/sulfate permease
MNRQFDPLTVALTGQLSMVLIVAAVLALAFSLFLLWRYRRAVVKSMRRRSRADLLEPKGFLPPDEPHKPQEGELLFTFVGADRHRASPVKKNLLYRQARRRPWLAAFVYAIAGICFAAIMAAAFLLSGR